MQIHLTETKDLKIDFNLWNPLEYIGYMKSFQLWLKGEYAPEFRFFFCFIFFSLEIAIEDFRRL